MDIDELNGRQRRIIRLLVLDHSVKEISEIIGKHYQTIKLDLVFARKITGAKTNARLCAMYGARYGVPESEVQ